MATFEVTLHDLAGNTITIPSTPNKSIASLIEQFRETANIPLINKRQKIVLIKEGAPLEGTLGENGIQKETTLLVAYQGKISCIDPDLILYLHEWINRGFILFYDPTRYDPTQEPVPMAHIPLPHRPKTYHADCNDLFEELNDWTIGEEYLFFLTPAPPQEPMSFPFHDTMAHYVPSVGPLNITLYPHGVHSASHDTMSLRPFSSVRGTLHGIKLYMTIKRSSKQNRSTKDDYECKYQFRVYLQGPIEIRDERGIIASLGEEALCMMKYDHIVACDDTGQPEIPYEMPYEVPYEAKNRNQGGRRSKRSKRSGPKKSRRTRRRVRASRGRKEDAV